MTEPGRPVRVLVVEDHGVVAEALAAYLGDSNEIDVVGTANTVRDAVDQAGRHEPEVVLMDFHLPDGSGAEAAGAILANRPEVAMIFLSADDSEDALMAAVRAGAIGYLSKVERGTELVDAIKLAAGGEMLIPAATLAKLLARQDRLSASDAEQERLRRALTPREMEVLQLMSDGFDSHGMAEHLGISFNTVRTHVQNVLEKLAAHSRLEAVRVAQELGLI